MLKDVRGDDVIVGAQKAIFIWPTPVHEHILEIDEGKNGPTTHPEWLVDNGFVDWKPEYDDPDWLAKDENDIEESILQEAFAKDFIRGRQLDKSNGTAAFELDGHYDKWITPETIQKVYKYFETPEDKPFYYEIKGNKRHLGNLAAYIENYRNRRRQSELAKLIAELR